MGRSQPKESQAGVDVRTLAESLKKKAKATGAGGQQLTAAEDGHKRGVSAFLTPEVDVQDGGGARPKRQRQGRGALGDRGQGVEQ